MSSVRARSARQAPSKKIHADQATTGSDKMSWNTSSRIPNGAATLKSKTSRPIADHNRIGTESAAATTNRRRMSATIAAIDMPAWPP